MGKWRERGQRSGLRARRPSCGREPGEADREPGASGGEEGALRAEPVCHAGKAERAGRRAIITTDPATDVTRPSLFGGVGSWRTTIAEVRFTESAKPTVPTSIAMSVGAGTIPIRRFALAWTIMAPRKLTPKPR